MKKIFLLLAVLTVLVSLNSGEIFAQRVKIDFKSDEVLCSYTVGTPILQSAYGVAKILTPPSETTNYQAEVLFVNGVKMWTDNVLPSHKATKEELKVGMDILWAEISFYPNLNVEIYRKAMPWAFGRITSLDELFKGIVEVNGAKLYLKWLRVPDEELLVSKEEPFEKKPVKKAKKLEIINIKFDSIFPIFFKYYDDNPVGRATLHNGGDYPIEDIKVSLFVKQYMDNPKVCKAPDRLGGGEKKQIDLYALFTNKVLEISEGTKVSASIILEYTLEGKIYKDEHIETIRLYNRNAITWDDDKKASAFVTAKDYTVLQFSKNVVGMIKGKASKALNQNLLLAIGLHEALSLYGMSYVVDPTTPYKELSRKKFAVDFLQFPKQSLEFKAGDCDDLSILYSALLESVGVETAFITIPGHIFMAFSLGIKPDLAKKKFLRPDDLIFKDNKAWISVEVTEIDGGFLKAWQKGAKQWRENEARGKAGFYPMHESWAVYEPVGFSGEKAEISLPPEDRIISAYSEEVKKFIEREIYPRVEKIQAEIKRTKGSAKSANKLGVLYAWYGLNDKAESEFSKILEKEEYVPALVNMGNVYYLKDDMKNALGYYDRAYKRAPDNPRVLLCIARVHHELGNYSDVRVAYRKLKTVDPDLAKQFSYLDLRGEEATRAAEMGKIEEVVIWEEE